MSDDLVKRVAQQFSHLDHLNYEYGKQHTWNDYARAAIAVVLEEAAKVCDEIETAEHRKWKQHADMMAQGASDGAGDCAAAIRALVKETA